MSSASRILLSLVCGIGLGIVGAGLDQPLAKATADIADPIGTLWLNGLRMTIIPLVVALSWSATFGHCPLAISGVSWA